MPAVETRASGHALAALSLEELDSLRIAVNNEIRSVERWLRRDGARLDEDDQAHLVRLRGLQRVLQTRPHPWTPPAEPDGPDYEAPL